MNRKNVCLILKAQQEGELISPSKNAAFDHKCANGSFAEKSGVTKIQIPLSQS
jgi:hypothetical protein